jgi:glycosyltransferase involved in cell wall biosynthesis
VLLLVEGAMRILWASDSPHLNTGFAKATREVLSRLAEVEGWDVSCLGWYGEADVGEPSRFGYRLYPAGPPQDPQGLLQVTDLVRPDVLVALSDVWSIGWLVDAPLPEGTKVVLYFPVDGAPLRSAWVEALKRCRHIVTISAFGERTLREALDGRKVARIQHGVDPSVFRPLEDRADQRARFVFGPDSASLADRFVVGCVARNQPRKQFPILIEAFEEFSRRHPEAFLYLHTAPLDSGWDIPELLKQHGLTERAALPERADALGGCSDEDLNRLYNLMDVFALPTMGEGFGLPILEAMAAGTPVVATDCTSVTELVSGRGELIRVKDWLVAPGSTMEQAIPDREHLVELLEKLYGDPALRRAHAEEGRRLAEELTWDRAAERWQAFLTQIGRQAAAKPPPRKQGRKEGTSRRAPAGRDARQRAGVAPRELSAVERFERVFEPPSPQERQPTMAIFAPTFYDEISGEPWMGGGERYVVDLAELLKEMGVLVDLFQPSASPWKREYGGLAVYGLGVIGFDQDVFPEANILFHSVTETYRHTIYSGPQLCYPRARADGIVISHGIWWDTLSNGWWRTSEWRRRLVACLQNAGLVVSVDTNTINWIRAEMPELAPKCRYLPNAVDLDRYRPGPDRAKGGPLRVLYPRRLVPGRGFEVMLGLALELADRREDVRFRFVGRGPREAERRMQKLAKSHPRIDWEWRALDEMPEVYQEADISVFPTQFSEGTSLSCLEALASGNAVVATNVGGLGNIVIDGHNGLLVEPHPGAVRSALLRLLDDGELRHQLGTRARETAQAFSKSTWRERWRGILRETCFSADRCVFAPAERASKLPPPVVAVASLTHWGHTAGGQRPQKIAEALLRRGYSVLHIQDGDYVSSELPERVRAMGCRGFLKEGLLGPSRGLDAMGLWQAVDRVCEVRPSLVIFAACSQAMLAMARLFKAEGIPVVYDVLDDWEAFDRVSLPRWYDAGCEREFVNLADRVAAVSPALVDKLGADRVALCPNAVDWQLMVAPDPGDPPWDMPTDGEVTVGYVGSLAGQWHDWKVVEEIARRRPTWRVVLIGPGGEHLPVSLTKLPNVSVLPAKAHADIAGYIDHFDVGIVPFDATALSKAVSPIKAYDYLSRGRSVVSSPMTGVDVLPMTRVARGPDEWIAAIEAAASERADRPIQWLWSNSWNARLTDLGIDDRAAESDPEVEALRTRLRHLQLNPHRTSIRVHWLMASACNYHCLYCNADRDAQQVGAQWTEEEMREAWDRFNSAHGACQIGVAGLEPMVGQRNAGILAYLSQENTLDINTNLAFPLPVLEAFARPENVFFSASFHPSEGVSAEQFIDKVRAVEVEGFTVLGASIVGYPPYLPYLSEWRRRFAEAGVNLVVRPCDGTYEGRRLSAEYTASERRMLREHLDEEATRLQLDGASAKGTLCATGWKYLLVRADGSVARCPQGAGDLGGLSFYRDPIPLRDHPTVCPFDQCWCEDLWGYHLTASERVAYLSAALRGEHVPKCQGDLR